MSDLCVIKRNNLYNMLMPISEKIYDGNVLRKSNECPHIVLDAKEFSQQLKFRYVIKQKI